MKKLKYTQIHYPGFIGLIKGSYFYVYSEDKLLGLVTILEHQTALDLLDLSSEIEVIKSEKGKDYRYRVPPDKKNNGALFDLDSLNKIGVTLVDHLPDHDIEDAAIIFESGPFPRIGQNVKFTKLILTREFKSGENKDDLSQEQEILERFILKYRELSSDINIKLPSESHWNSFGIVPNAVIELSANEQKLSPEGILTRNVKLPILSTKQVSFDIRELRKASKPTFDFKKITIELKNSLQKENKIDQFIKVKNKVTEEIFIYDNYKYAFLEMFFFLESFIVNFLKEKKIEKGISRQKIDDADVTLSYLINIELPLVLEVQTDTIKKVLGELNWARKKRNNVVHNGELVEKNHALKLNSAVDNLVKILNNARQHRV